MRYQIAEFDTDGEENTAKRRTVSEQSAEVPRVVRRAFDLQLPNRQEKPVAVELHYADGSSVEFTQQQ